MRRHCVLKASGTVRWLENSNCNCNCNGDRGRALSPMRHWHSTKPGNPGGDFAQTGGWSSREFQQRARGTCVSFQKIGMCLHRGFNGGRPHPPVLATSAFRGITPGRSRDSSRRMSCESLIFVLVPDDIVQTLDDSCQLFL